MDLGGSTPLTATSVSIFTAKYALAGAPQWARSFSATGTTGFENGIARSVAVDSRGDVMLAGTFCGTITFGGAVMSSGDNCSVSNSDIFVTRLANSDGAHVSSVRVGGGDVARSPISIRIVPAVDGRTYLGGDFVGFAEIGGNGLTANNADVFITALAPL